MWGEKHISAHLHAHIFIEDICCCVEAEMHRAFCALSWGGEKMGLFACVCVHVIFFSLSLPPLQHPRYKRKKKSTQTEFSLRKPLPRQLESEKLQRQHGPWVGKKIKHTAIAHEIQRCVMIHIGAIKASGAHNPPTPHTHTCKLFCLLGLLSVDL